MEKLCENSKLFILIITKFVLKMNQQLLIKWDISALKFKFNTLIKPNLK